MRRHASARLGLIAAVAILATRPAAAEVTVAVNGGYVDLNARSAPLSDVLDSLARQTRMEVTYDGAPPRHLVTAAVQAATPAQAVLSVLEGLGVNYAILLDRTGHQVKTLLVVTRAPSVAAPVRVAAPALPFRGPRPPPPDELFEEEPMDDEDEPALEALPGRARERLERMRPGPMRPGLPGVFQPSVPSAEAPVPGTGAAAPAYPVSPFAPVPVLPQVPTPQAPPQQTTPQPPPQSDPDTF
ncbi:MAG TPA: hypothetical protein VMT87_01890 [Vicinamibacteria bacterium]|nr:hypothetical protein [Vicinamibacteria bacterium]